jgi:threonine synthase
MWRYGPVLPPRSESIVTLGEGMTPLLRANGGAKLGAKDLWIKDEGLNPTGSFKARGLSCAVSMAVELGVTKIAIPSAGNAASALAAYAAAAGIEAHIFMPRDVPNANFIECQAFGAFVTLVDGLISDCAKMVAAGAAREGWYDVSTLKEPYRIEGKKTMGYEVAEQLDWQLPDAIFYPTGGGVGIIGMWKAFDEMEALGWIGPRRPKMIAVQAEGCQPVVRAFERGEARSQFWDNAWTVASGLRVPKPLGDFLILEAVRASGGTGAGGQRCGTARCGRPAGARGRHLRRAGGRRLRGCVGKAARSGFLKPEERIVIYNTGAGLKYLEAYATRFPERDPASRTSWAA